MDAKASRKNFQCTIDLNRLVVAIKVLSVSLRRGAPIRSPR